MRVNPEEDLEPLEWELQVVREPPDMGLGTELRSFARAASAPNC